jgi:hypothetical protein
MTYDEALKYARQVRQELKKAAGDNIDALWEQTNKRTLEDQSFAEALRTIGFRHVLEDQQTRH